MDDRSDTIDVCILGLLAVGALAIMGTLAIQGQPIPASIGAAFGTAVGALTMRYVPRNGRN